MILARMEECEWRRCMQHAEVQIVGKDQTELHVGGENKEGIKSQACTHARGVTHSKEVVDWKVHTSEERDFLRKEVISGAGCNTPLSNSCNLVLIMVVIVSLNQVWNKFKRILSKFKSISIFHFFI
jgi:hypothetical protein